MKIRWKSGISAVFKAKMARSNEGKKGKDN